jgi:hypothetical protein
LTNTTFPTSERVGVAGKDEGVAEGMGFSDTGSGDGVSFTTVETGG